RSNLSALQPAAIGPAAVLGITSQVASARASAASKSSMCCSIAMSSQTARIGPLDSIGASRGEREVLIARDLTTSRPALPIFSPGARGFAPSNVIALVPKLLFLFGAAWLTWGNGFKISGEAFHGHDNEWGGPAGGIARDGVGQAE